MSAMGERPSFETVMNEHWEAVCGLCRSILASDEDGEEVAQQTFFQAYRAWPRFEGRSSVRTWLFRIAVNACRKFVTRTRRHAAQPLDDPGLEAACEPSSAEATERTAQVRAAIRAIAPAHRAVLVLFYLEGLGGREVSDVLQCSEGTLWSRLYHARAALEDKLRARRLELEA